MHKHLFALLVLTAAGCETGHEIAGVSKASAVREPNGAVVVDATIDCMLVEGMGRANNTCDADGDRFCVEAHWFQGAPDVARPTLSSAPVATGRSCQTVDHVRGGTVKVQVRAASVPATAHTVVVFTTGQAMFEQRVPLVVIESP